MRIVVTGREGQVVRSLLERAEFDSGIEIVALGRPALNLVEPTSVWRAIEAARPEVVISAAAYTAVDTAEREPDLARQINEAGARAVAEAARASGAPLIHLSTDYVFSGTLGAPYREEMATEPANVYGRTKLAGEQAVRQANPRAVIVRTGWVYSPFGRNFVRTMLKLASEQDKLSVVDDQIGNPTSALDIADAILAIARRIAREPAPAGIYHYVGRGDVTWCGFARHILAESTRLGGPGAAICPIRTSDYPTAAARPADSRLDTTRIAAKFGIETVDWRVGTRTVVARLVAAEVGASRSPGPRQLPLNDILRC